MNYFDDAANILHVDCTACGKPFERSMDWLLSHKGKWTCPNCGVTFVVNTQPGPSASVVEKRSFYSKIAGVSYENSDGSSRQNIIQRCREGEPLTFRCEPDNPVDPHAVKVLRATGEQLGYLEARLASELCKEVASGEIIPCYISSLTGGEPGKPTRGVNIYIGGEPARVEARTYAASGVEPGASYPETSTSGGALLIGLLTLVGIVVAVAYVLSLH